MAEEGQASACNSGCPQSDGQDGYENYDEDIIRRVVWTCTVPRREANGDQAAATSDGPPATLRGRPPMRHLRHTHAADGARRC